MNTQVEYLGLSLASPIVVGSCALTSELDNVRKMKEFGAGAVVLKSLFEEQILLEIGKMGRVAINYGYYNDSYDYIKNHINNDDVEKYLQYIKTVKKEVDIPVIGSINCFSFDKWVYFVKKIEDAGADALELNMNFLPTNVNMSAEDVENLYGDIIGTLKKSSEIPIVIKCGNYFTDMAKFLQRISWMGIKGLTLFNKNVGLDIDIEKMEYKNPCIYSGTSELCNTLQWTAILSNMVRCNISATGGVQIGEDVIKLLLAGAANVQVVSCLYRNGISYIKELKKDLETWMSFNGYDTIEDFRGVLSMKSVKNPDALMRIRLMKDYTEFE